MYGWRKCPYCHKDLQDIPLEDIEKWRNEGRDEVVKKAKDMPFLKTPMEGDPDKPISRIMRIINTLNFWTR